MNDGMIHIPARKRRYAQDGGVIKVTPEAYNALVDIYNESSLSLKDIASLIIMQSADRVVFDKEG